MPDPETHKESVEHVATYRRDLQYYKFCLYGFLKNLRFFEPFIILFFLEKGFAYLQIGALYAIREVATNVLEIPTGVIADAMGRRRTMIYAFLAYIAAFIVFYFSASFAICALSMVLFSFGEAFRTGTHKAMILEYLRLNGWQDQKVHYYGHTRAWSQLGSALSSVIAASIVFISGRLSVVFLYTVLPSVLGLALMVSYPRELEGRVRRFNRTWIWGNFGKVLREFVVAFRNPKLLRAISNVSVYGGFYKALKDYLQPVLNSLALALPILLALQDRQRTAVVIGAVYFVLYVLTSYAARYSGKAAERFRSLRVPLNLTLALGLGLGVAAGLLYHAQLLIAAAMCYIGIYLVQNLRRPMGVAIVSDMLKEDILATALSAESQLKTLVAAMVAPLVGFLADRLGVGQALIITCCLLLVILPGCLIRRGTP